MYNQIDIREKNHDDKKRILGLLMLIVVVGLLTSKISSIALLWGISIFSLGMYLTIKTRNRNGIAHLFAAYLMAAEVYFRMSWGGLPWEFSKYAIIGLLGMALLIDKQDRKLPLLMIAFVVLLLPAIMLTIGYYDDVSEVRKKILFNLLGPIVLIVSTFYFYKLKLSMKDFVNISRAIVFGVLTMGVLVYFNVGDYTALEFTFSSSFDASGGFSGNQVSIMFGVGILILGVNLLLKNSLFVYKSLDLLLLMLFIFQALMTFSRGGLFTAIVSLIIGMFVYYFSNLKLFILFLKKSFFKILILAMVSIGVFIIVNDITDDKLYSRYFNVDSSGQKLKDDYTTGRGDISKGDLELFTDSGFVGVGVGVSIMERPYHKNYAAHIEYTRLLAEHGILGLLIIIILFYMPFSQFIKLLNNPLNSLLLVSFSVLSLISMTHAATRVGAIGFFFGLAFILIIKEKNERT